MKPKDIKGMLEDMNVFELQGLEHIKIRPDILQRIRFDVRPKMIMEPCFDSSRQASISGCFFYVEAYDDPPQVMLMKVSPGGVTSTIGKVEEIPAEMVKRAVDDPVDPPVNQMYAVTEEICDWLKENLEV